VDALASAPWPVGIAAGVLGFGLVLYGIPAFLGARSPVFAQVFAGGPLLTLLACAVLLICWMAALASFTGARRRRNLLDTRTSLQSIAEVDWRDFERLVGEAFRRKGYRVEENGLGGADGGIDLVLAREGRRVLVQCKQWHRDKVPVNVVREMYGLLAHHRADEVVVATLGGFTRDAEQFAHGKPIRLLDGSSLLRMIREVQSAEVADSPGRSAQGVGPSPMVPTADVPGCPRCGSAMVRNVNRQHGSAFWGRSRFPDCRGTRSLAG